MRRMSSFLPAMLLSCFWLPALPVSAQVSEGSNARSLIKASRLVDVRAGGIREDQWLLVEGERIRAVGAAGSLDVPADARVVDLADLTILPGLIDTHTHLTSDPTIPRYQRLGLSVPRNTLIDAANARRTLLAGFTTIRNVGAPGYSDVALRDAIAATFGTDAGIFPHGDNAKQFAIMIRYGMTPADALRAATINGADALGLAGELGELTAGQRADIIAVAGDPLSDVTRLENVEFVMKDGVVYKAP